MRSISRVRLAIALTILPIAAAAYAAELFLTFPPSALADRYLRKNPAMFDPLQATARIRSSGRNVYPMTTEALYNRPPAPPKRDTTPIPLAGISHSAIVLCNESGEDLVIESDRHGFSNPDSVWDRKPASALVGDSFTQGECVGPRADIASNLRKEFIVVNAGVSGTGPIRQLAILREYVAPLQSPMVFWLFFEGNDIEDIEAERRTAAARYLDSSFTQNLIGRQWEVDAELRSSVEEGLNHLEQKGRRPKLADLLLLRRLRGVLHLGFHSSPPERPPDFETLVTVLAEAKSSVGAWGGNLTLVYLPDRRRFTRGERRTIGGGHDLDAIHTNVIAMSRRLGIPVIDMAEKFARAARPLDYWTGPRSHYDSAGYAAVAKELVATEPRRHGERRF